MHLKFWNKLQWIKAMKIACGAVAAILLAEALGLQSAASAGIITLLTVQNTRRETLTGSFRRVIAFGIMTLLCGAVYTLCSTAPWAFGLVLLLLLLLCYGLHLEDSIPINAVMATHYMMAGGVSLPMIGNEALLLVIGSGIGIGLNWFMPDNLHKIKAQQHLLDEEIRQILKRMAGQLLQTDHSTYTDACFRRTDACSQELHREIEQFLQNHTWQNEISFAHYVTMRQEQCLVLRGIYHQIQKLTAVPTQAQPLSRLFSDISDQYHAENDFSARHEQLDTLNAAYQKMPLPDTRSAFENRAVLYCILTELRTFLEIKRDYQQAYGNEHAA